DRAQRRLGGSRARAAAERRAAQAPGRVPRPGLTRAARPGAGRFSSGLPISADARSREPARVCYAARLQRPEKTMAEQVRASHILLMYAGSARSSATRTKQQAEQQIEAL